LANGRKTEYTTAKKKRKKEEEAQWPKEKSTTGQTTIYKTIHIKLKTE
jgi:hypothetical protein